MESGRQWRLGWHESGIEGGGASLTDTARKLGRLVEKMRQSLKLGGNNELTSPTGNLQGRSQERSVEIAEKKAVCGSSIIGMQLQER